MPASDDTTPSDLEEAVAAHGGVEAAEELVDHARHVDGRHGLRVVVVVGQDSRHIS